MEKTTIDVSECMKRIQSAGYSGFKIWAMGGEYMACLTAPAPDLEPIYSTNLWNWADTAETAILLITEKAERMAKG